MTKIAIITDTHYGVRGDAVMFLDYQKKFLDNVFFPYIDNNNIKHVFHLGDLVDRRKYISYMTANRLKQDFLIPLSMRDCTTHILAGNHDIYHKNTNELNALRELVANKFENIKVYTNTTWQVNVGNCGILLVPWITQENEEDILNSIATSECQICFGHFELKGFEMDKGNLCSHGHDSKILDKFDVVMSGHFHHKSTNGNIHYLGAPFEMTWIDYNDPKGFHIFDTATRELEFIKNPYTLFNKIYYNDNKYKYEEMVSKLKDISIENSYIKLIVDEKQSPYLFDRFIQEIEKLQPYDLKIVEQQQLQYYDTNIDQAEDTLTILKKSIQQLDIQCDKKKLESLVKDLYIQANAMEI